MNETQSNRDVSDIGGWGFYSVITVSFEDDDKAHDALMLLKQLDSQHQVGMDEAVLILREADGRVVEMDRVASAPMPNTVGGGLVGLLVGIIGGPLGILIGGTTGSLVGTLFDFQDADKTESALTTLSSAVRPGHTALLAVVKEQNRDVVDTAMSGWAAPSSDGPCMTWRPRSASPNRRNARPSTRRVRSRFAGGTNATSERSTRRSRTEGQTEPAEGPRGLITQTV